MGNVTLINLDPNRDEDYNAYSERLQDCRDLLKGGGWQEGDQVDVCYNNGMCRVSVKTALNLTEQIISDSRKHYDNFDHNGEITPI